MIRRSICLRFSACLGPLAAVLLMVGWGSTSWAQRGGADFPKEKHIRSLKTGTEKTKQDTLDELERMGSDPKVLEVLLDVLRRERRSAAVPDSKFRMLQMTTKFPDSPEVIEVLRSFLVNRNYRLIMVAVDALGELRAAVALDEILNLKDHPAYAANYGFRKAVLEAVMKWNDPRCIEFLIQQLEVLDGQLQYDVVRYLHHISYQPFATNAEAWKTWWSDNGGDFQFEENPQAFSLSGEPPEGFVWDQAAAQFFDLYIHAKRLVFVLDASSSMSAMVGEASRFDMARRELAKSIQSLPEDSSFGIIVFHGQLAPWGRTLQQATAENKERAIKWIEDRKMGQGTASFDALEAGMELDGNTEAIFFLSDGKPSKGKITDPQEIITTITRMNFFQRIAIYTVGLAIAGGPTEVMMKDLAAKNSGAYQAVNR